MTKPSPDERFQADVRAVAVKMARLAPYYETIQPLADEIQTAIERLEKEEK